MTAISVASPHHTLRPVLSYRVRWDRVALLATAVLLFMTTLVVVGTGESQADAIPVPSLTVVVQPSDTLWDLAAEHAPAGLGTLEYAALVSEVNGVSAGSLLPGSVLELPQE